MRLRKKQYVAALIGVDDFAYKKGNRYGTVIIDAETHNLIEILDGRDENTLKEWLKKNKHIKAVTRDRASAYASAIQAILPDAMQIADRFHLHQNLLDAVKDIVNGTIPTDIKIPVQSMKPDDVEDNSKKNLCQCG